MSGFAKLTGFKSEKELASMVASVDLSHVDAINDFTDWKQSDGTKAGLAAIIGKTHGAPPPPALTPVAAAVRQAFAADDGHIYVVSYGGGTNSTAILLGMAERGIRPALILFADTGNEKLETYEHLQIMSDWCMAVFGIPITVVKNDLPQGLIDGSLYGECMRLGTMPSKLFGHSTCSMKWKVQPQEKYLTRWMRANGVEHIQHVIGYDADELHRAAKAETQVAKIKEEKPGYRSYETNRYLLIEWNWGRDECVAVIGRFGLKQPGKSACFMCPSSKKHEVVWLKATHPGRYIDAIVMEARALAGEGQAPAARVEGLGRHWNWQTFAGSDVGTPETDCGCYDGD